MDTKHRYATKVRLMVLAIIVAATSGCATMRTDGPAVPAAPAAQPEPAVPTAPPIVPAPNVQAPDPEPPLPPLTNNYVVFAYDADRTLISGTMVGLDFSTDEAAAGRKRDPDVFKGSALNASCVAAADGHGLPDDYKDPGFQAFCEGKSINWCIAFAAQNMKMDRPADPLVNEFCGLYSRWQGERHVTLVTDWGDIPAHADEYRLYCCCEGAVSQPYKEDDPETGPCTNRVNCQLVGPPGPIADKTLTEK